MSEPRDIPANDPPPGDERRGESEAGDLRRRGNEGGPVGLRVGRNPANLGDEVPESSDVTYPPPVTDTPEM